MWSVLGGCGLRWSRVELVVKDNETLFVAVVVMSNTEKDRQVAEAADDDDDEPDDWFVLGRSVDGRRRRTE